MKKTTNRIIKSVAYRSADLLYRLFPKRSVLRLYCSLTNIMRSITWKLACSYYGPEIIRYRGDIVDFILNEIKEGDHVLDLGCAEGNLTRFMAKKAKSVVGLDMDSGYIDKIDKTKEEFKNVKFMTGDIFKTDFNAVFDVAVLVHMLEHVSDSGRLLDKISNFSRKIVIETPNPDADWISKLLNDLGIIDLGDDTHFELFNEEKLKKVLENNGWEKVIIQKGEGVVRAVAFSSVIKGK